MRQDEYAASGQRLLMWRGVIAALAAALEARSEAHLLLDGMPGSGKSVALAALAHWARLRGWVVRALICI
jgi:predicted ATPase